MQQDILHITNGDCAVRSLHEAGITGAILPWRDVLHEGPVPADLDLGALSDIRIRFITERGWGETNEIRRRFEERDRLLRNAGRRDEVVLWLEDDLYDQLQLLQILDGLPTNSPPVWIVEVEGALGGASGDQIRRAQATRREIGSAQIELARAAWAAFRSPTPEAWEALLHLDLAPLPNLRSAVFRLLEELPDPRSGLPRTHRVALVSCADGPRSASELFALYQATEDRPFLGDTIFWSRLHELLQEPEPLLRLVGGLEPGPDLRDHTLTRTPTAEAVLAGRQSWLELGSIDRWLGGTHLRPESLWLWDPEQQTLQHG